MSASLYIVVEGEDPGFDTFVNGSMLAQHHDALEQLATYLHSAHLLDFFSADADSMGLLEQEGFKLPTPAYALPPTQWFSAEDGLIAVSELHEYLEFHPRYLGQDTPLVMLEMEEFLTVLEKAASRNLRWHLSVSWR